MEYADEAALFIENDNRDQMCERIGNYDISTEIRVRKIQWVKVRLLVHAGRAPREELPPPFDQIKIRQGGTILGDEIYMTGNLNRSVEARIKMANNTWKQVNRKIFRSNAFNRKIKRLLWNSIIRCAIIYGLHTMGMPRYLIGEIKIYMYKHIIAMVGPNWEIEAWYPAKTTLQETAAFDYGIMSPKHKS